MELKQTINYPILSGVLMLQTSSNPKNMNHTYETSVEDDEELDKMNQKDICDACGNYKTNRKKKWCNSCEYVNS